MHKIAKLGLVLLACIAINIYTMDKKYDYIEEGVNCSIEKAQDADYSLCCVLKIISAIDAKVKIKNRCVDTICYYKNNTKSFDIKLNPGTVNMLLFDGGQENAQRYELKISAALKLLITEVQDKRAVSNSIFYLHR